MENFSFLSVNKKSNKLTEVDRVNLVCVVRDYTKTHWLVFLLSLSLSILVSFVEIEIKKTAVRREKILPSRRWMT